MAKTNRYGKCIVCDKRVRAGNLCDDCAKEVRNVSSTHEVTNEAIKCIRNKKERLNKIKDKTSSKYNFIFK